MKVTDKLGQRIRKGDYIVYGHALGRCAGLRIGRVIADPTVEENETEWGRRFEHRVPVWGVDDDWYYNDPKLLSKKSTLFFPDRTVVLHPTQVPQWVKDLLEPVYGA